jgi:hypothetical protein
VKEKLVTQTPQFFALSPAGLEASLLFQTSDIGHALAQDQVVVCAWSMVRQGFGVGSRKGEFMLKVAKKSRYQSHATIWQSDWVRGLLGAAVLVGALVCAVPTWAGAVSFSDNFTPSPSPLWGNNTGNWTASSGDYFAQVPNNNPGAVTLLPFDLTDYTLTTTVNAVGDGGIVVRENTAGTESITLVLGGLGYGQGVRCCDAGTAIYWGDNSNSLQGEVTGVFTPGNTYTITVTAVGDTFSAYIDGSSTPVTTLTDSIAGPDGIVGLYDDQPNTTTGSGFGPGTSFSNFSLQGTALNTVPEPSGAVLFSSGLAGLALMWYRTRSRTWQKN